MSSLDFEGRPVPIESGDTVASALYRAGVRIFSRSFKYHRPRGLYCLTGDCPNCLVTVDGEPAVRSCVTPACAGQRVERPNGWPSVERDALGILWRLRWMLPVGFYYKSMIHPKGLWPWAERFIRKIAGIGPVPRDLPPAQRERRYHHPDLFVAGGGLAGLTAARAAARAGQSVVVAEEGAIGEQLPLGPARDALERLTSELRGMPNVTLLERAMVVGVYEGPLVPVAGTDFLHLVLPRRVVVATGAAERHAVFPGSDLPGVWLGRGAVRMVVRHRLSIGRRVVFAGTTEESVAQLTALHEAGVPVAAALLPEVWRAKVPEGVQLIPDGTVVQAHGRRRLTAVEVRSAAGTVKLSCDALVMSLGLSPRDRLLRQAEGADVVGAGEVVGQRGAPDRVIEGAERAAAGLATPLPQLELPAPPVDGIVCLCEDVGTSEIHAAWAEGFCSTEILKRYTTATMGPCQGTMCHAHLRALARAKSPETEWTQAPTTARPPMRPVRLEDVAAGLRSNLEYRTGLHDRHLAHGATMEWAGVWKRPERYGDVLEEYWAVRRGVSVMDVSTLGKYLVAGPDATAFLERLYPCRVGNIAPGRSRYALVLNEAGYLFDDGLICAWGPTEYYLTFTSGGADQVESWLRDWAETWHHRVHIVNRTATFGAINLAGPQAREVLARLADRPVDNAAFPYSSHREMTVAGVPCTVLRVGFVGELSYELHHPRRQGVRLWNALLEAGADLGIRPHGLEALRLLRLEKGHIIVGQDTDFDTTPTKIGLDWAVKMDKPAFVGRPALERLSTIEPDKALLSLVFDGAAPREGAQLLSDGIYVGYLTSSRYSPALGHGVALGWVRRGESGFPATVAAVDGSGQPFAGRVVQGPFYDPEGARLRA